MDVSAIIPTKGDVDLEPIRKHLEQYEEIKEIIFQKGDEFVFNRYRGIQKAKYDIVYTQDDDCLTDLRPILDAYEPDIVVNAMRKERINDYDKDITLIGWGAIFDKKMISVLDWWKKDELFMRECDRVFTAMTKHKTVFADIKDLPQATGSERMGSEERHWKDLELIKKRINEHKKWTQENELLYWKKYPDFFYRDYVWRKYNFFKVEDAKVAVDIGGGRFGGALPFIKADRKILIDKINFEIPGIETKEASFTDLPIGDDCIDCVFAWEVLDHADSIEDIRKGQKEIERILCNGGTLYFNQPVRNRATKGHHVLITPEEIMDGFNLDILTYSELPFYDNGIEIYATFKKTSN